MPHGVKQDEKIEEKLNIEILKRLLGYLKRYKRKIVLVVFFIAVVMTVDLINPYFLKIMIDQFIANKKQNYIIVAGIIIISLYFTSMLCSRMRTKVMSEVTNKVLLDIRQELFEHIQKLSFSFFDQRPVGKILARVIGDVNSLNNLFTNSVTTLIPETATIIAVIIIMFTMNYKLAFYSLSTLIFLLVSLFTIQTVSRKRWQKFRQKSSNLNGFTHENFSGIKVIQSFTAERYTYNNFSKLAHDLKDAFIKAVRINDLFWPLVEFSWGFSTIITFYFGIKMINSKTISIGLLVAFINYSSMFWRPIMNLSNYYNTLITNMASAERIFEILDQQPHILNDDNSIDIDIKGEVEFRNVSFSYDDTNKVLDNINFKVKPGEKIALVGHTGAGKTTIVNLICRFYETNYGEVLIDGYNIKNIKIECLRRQIGVMLHDTFLFSDSIAENIRYGKLDADDNKIVEASKAVHAHQFILKLENGYQTNVNERGTRLSSGQRQLISLARTLISAPKILILDEATANIDTYTERLLQDGINKILKGRTSFIIAHRLSTIKNADRIMVVEDGKIIEMGTHEELLNKRGIYYNMFASQFENVI